jgi:hypothetical protein
MCMDIRIKCNCGKNLVPFNMRNDIFSQEVVVNLFCPEESENVDFNKNTMINDNGWIIEYDMELAKFLGSRKLDISPDEITPEFIFDEGYATWKEIFPGEQEKSKSAREKIMALAKTDPKKYFEELRNWANKRMRDFKEIGWRKAQKVS